MFEFGIEHLAEAPKIHAIEVQVAKAGLKPRRIGGCEQHEHRLLEVQTFIDKIVAMVKSGEVEFGITDIHTSSNIESTPVLLEQMFFATSRRQNISLTRMPRMFIEAWSPPVLLLTSLI